MIKKFSLMALFAVVIFTLTVKAEESIAFEKSSWEEILKKAKEENKPVFLDAYASWCGPCKWMAKEIFTQKEVGKFYNQNFICAKIDMEKGEGIELAEKYGVNAYPTLLYIQPNGELAYKAVGAKEANNFIETGKRALNPEMHLNALGARFKKGERSVDFMADYFLVLSDAYQPYDDIAEEYFDNNQDELLTEKGAQLMVDYLTATDGTSFNFFLNNRAKLSELVGKEEVDNKLFQLYTSSYVSTREKTADGYKIDLDEFEEAVDAIKASGFERAKELEFKAYMFYYKTTDDKDKYIITTSAYLDNFPSESWQEYNQYAWYAYEHIEDNELLQKAARWAKKSIALEDNYYNEDTLAALLFKLGKYDEAEVAANKAIAFADEAGDDHTETSSLLEKIKAAQK